MDSAQRDPSNGLPAAGYWVLAYSVNAMPDIKGTLFWLAIVLALLIYLMNGCGSRMDRFREHRQQRQEDREQRWEEWRDERQEQRDSRRWRWRRSATDTPQTQL